MGHLSDAVVERFAPQGLPVSDCLEALACAISTHGLTALKAPPGSGKTLLAPVSLFEAGTFSRISILEPRRVTARLPALALREVCGPLVGYRIRLESLWDSKQTKLGYFTYGMALRRFLARPPAEHELVIFDEFHERSWEAELLLAYLRNLPSGPRLLLMSATLDLKSLPTDIPVVKSDGRLHPVKISWETTEPQLLGRRDRLANLVAQRSVELASLSRGEQLIFLPGLGDIRAVEQQLRADHLSGDIDILHSSLKDSELRRVVDRPQGAGFRRILSTDLAESSVTLPGITTVIDSGLSRRPLRDELDLGNTLRTLTAPLSALEQRAGRAGRLGPGACHRIFTKQNELHREAFPQPEMEQADYRTVALFLASVALLAKCDQLPWLHKPNAARLELAKSWCVHHQLMEADLSLTPKGKAVLDLPLSPRLAEFAITARWSGHSVKSVCAWCQALEDPPGQKNLSLEDWTTQRLKEQRGNRKLARLLEEQLQDYRPKEDRTLDEIVLGSYSDTLAALSQDRAVCANPDQAALHFEGTRGQSKVLALLLGTRPKGGQGPRSSVSLYHPVAQDLVWETQFDKLQEHTELIYSPSTKSVKQRQTLSLGQLILEETNLPAPPGPEVAKLLHEQISQADLGEVFHTLSRRMELFFQHRSPTGLSQLTPESFLISYLESQNRWTKSSSQELLAHIQGLLPYEVRMQMDRELPESANLPRRRKPVRVHYPAEGAPFIKSKLQDFFGWQQPVLLGGDVELVCHLLAPNGRACQITTDLKTFWAGSYRQVRKDLRGRYPKHDWPEDPTQLRI